MAREREQSPEPSSSSQAEAHRKQGSTATSWCNFSIESIMRHSSEPKHSHAQLMMGSSAASNHHQQQQQRHYTPSPSTTVASMESAEEDEEEDEDSCTSDIEPGEIELITTSPQSPANNHNHNHNNNNNNNNNNHHHQQQRPCKRYMQEDGGESRSPLTPLPSSHDVKPPRSNKRARSRSPTFDSISKWTIPPALGTTQPHQNQHLHQASTALPKTPSSSSLKYPMSRVECQLDNKDMWDKFHSLNTEMIITKTGRRMFPVMKVQFHNLDPQAKYAVSMDIVPVDNKRYRYAYHKSCWQVAGKADPSAEPRIYPHPDSPFNGDLLSRQVISFEKVKLTNNEMDKSGHIILNSMHKYQPRIHLVLWRDSQHHNHLNPSTANNNNSNHHHHHHHHQQQPPAPTFQLNQETHRTFVFSETVFTAVTAYQNQLITKMKIDKNPFAKGFRDSSRLSDLDRNDPFDYMSSLGPSGHMAAAAAAAQAGSSAAGSAAAAAGAYQLLAASAANNPWYSMASAAAASSPFNPMGALSAAAGSAQAAQLLANPVWLAAAFSACLNGGAGGGPTGMPQAPGTPSAAGSLQSAPSPPTHEQ